MCSDCGVHGLKKHGLTRSDYVVKFSRRFWTGWSEDLHGLDSSLAEVADFVLFWHQIRILRTIVQGWGGLQ